MQYTYIPRRYVRAATILAAALFLLTTASAAQVRFKIKLDPAVNAGVPLSGRLLIFMKKDDGTTTGFGPDFGNPNAVFVSGTEITNLTSARDIEINADEDSFPMPFSKAPAGDYV